MKTDFKRGFPVKKTVLAQAVSAALLGVPLAALAQDGNQLEEVVVTGIRGSLEQSLDTKRDAGAVVDAITSEDIGKFPDKNVADSLQRVPGISVDRIWGEGRDIFVRGTNSTLNRTLMNGQNVASAFWWANDNPSRGFNYSILASELVASLEVHKSPQADLDEGSIGGTVIVRTRRPMDLDPLTVQGTFEQQYSELPDEWDPQVSGLFSWHNDDDTFGALVSVSSQERTVRRDGLEAFPNNTLYDVTDADSGEVTEDVYAPWGGGSAIFQQARERVTSNLTLQFRPTEQWDMALNYVKSDMDMDNSNQNYLFLAGGYKLTNEDPITGNPRPRDPVSDPEFISTSDGRQALVGGTIENPGSPGAAIEPIVRDAFIESEVLDFELDFEGDGWRFHGQVGKTSAEGGSRHDRNYWFHGNSRINLSLGPRTNEFSFPEVDPLNGDALSLIPENLRDWVRIMEDDEDYLQGDAGFDVDWGAFNSVKTGFKLRDHTIENNRSVGSVDVNDPDIADEVQDLRDITLGDVSRGPSPVLHGETATAGSLRQYAFLDFDLARQEINSILDSGVMDYSVDTQAFYRINEEISAVYGMTEFETANLRGNLGLRYVDTDQSSRAFQDGVLGTVTRTYSEVLPSFNIAYNIRDDLLFRGALSRAMARPTFQNLSSNIVINATSGSASAGNPNLDPTLADQFETGLEWYFAEASLLSATLFYKDLDTFVFQRTADETIDGQSLSVTRPFNASDGAEIRGLELQWQQDLGNNFGAVANYTLTDVDVPPDPNTGAQLELPGNSEDQMNASVYYEDDSVSIRLSYNYRSESFGALTSGSQIKTDDYDQWDATASWYATDALSLFMTAVNITNEVIYQSTDDGIPVGFYENGPRYSLGLRAQF